MDDTGPRDGRIARFRYEFDAEAARHGKVKLAWQRAQHLHSTYHREDLCASRRIAEQVDTHRTCPTPEIARGGPTLRRWRDAFLAYLTTSRSSSDGAAAVNGRIELHQRLVRGYRNRENHRLRALLVAGGLA